MHIDKDSEPLPGYRLIELLGEGGFGQVWKAEAPGGFKVALKFIRVDTQQADPELRSLDIIREIRHPFLLDIHFATQVEDRLIIATSLCDQSLLDRLRFCQHNGMEGIPPRELLRYMEGSAIGLDYLNEPHHVDSRGIRMGIQHRDIKPHNIFLVGGSVKLADFGLAKVLENSVVSHTGSMTPVYAAPEVFRGKTCSKSDQYSLAVTYVQLRTGRLPYKGNHHEIIYCILEGEPNLADLPEAEREVINRAMSKDASKRWPSCRAMVKSLRKVIKSANETDSAKGVVRKPRVVERHAKKIATPAEPISASTTSVPLTLKEPPFDATQYQKSSRRRSIPPAAIAPFTAPKASGYQRLWGAYLNVEAFSTNSIGMRMALIPPGQYRMGSPTTDEDSSADEHPEHVAHLDRPFLLASCQVTLQQFRTFVDDSGYRTEGERDGNGGWGYNPETRRFEGRKPQYNWQNVGWEQTEHHPVVNVTWNDAVAFCEWLTKKENLLYRLPSEVEWEFACRAGTTTKFSFGSDHSELYKYANVADRSLRSKWASASWAQPWDDGYPFTSPVGQFLPNPFGLYDMHGNVWEWCTDWYDPHAYKDVVTWHYTTTPTTQYRVLRGGSWLDLPQLVRSADRHGLEPQTRYCNNGFRVARSIDME